MRTFLMIQFMYICLLNTALCNTNMNANLAMDNLRHAVRTIQQQDRAGLNVYQSDRTAEVKNFELDVGPADNTNSVSTLLKVLAQPSGSSMEIRHTDNDVRKQLACAHIIPLWLNNKWIDGSKLAANGLALPLPIKNKLVELNYLEQIVGVHAVPAREHQASLGGGRSKIISLRHAINQAGYVVKFDKTFSLWRVTGTNAPTIKTP